MFEVELGLLSNGLVGIEGALDAVPQAIHVHGGEYVPSWRVSEYLGVAAGSLGRREGSSRCVVPVG